MNNQLFDATLVLAGPDFDRLSFQELSAVPLIVAVDGGLNHLTGLHCTVNLHLGDMDSFQPAADLPEVLKVMTFQPEKDDSDFRLALDLIQERGCKRVAVFGGLGGRIDHFLQIYESAVEFAGCGMEITIFGLQERIVLTNVADFSVELPLNTTVSVFAGTAECTGVTLSGFKYPLSNYLMKRNYPVGLSNLTVQETVSITHSSGVLAVVLNKK